MTQEFFIDKVYDKVSGELDRLNGETDEYKLLFEQTMAALAAAGLPTLSPLPVFPDPPVVPSVGGITATKPSAPVPSNIGINMPAEPGDIDLTSELDAIIAQIPVFVPSVTGLEIPNAPAPINTSGAPSRPEVNTNPLLPAEPDLTLPSLDPLVPITVPEFVFPELPTFTEVLPTLDATAPASVLAWSEPPYESEQFNTVWAKVQTMLSGQSGLPAAVEKALFDRARSRDDEAALKATQEAFEVFAGKGYSMPPGMLAKQVNFVQEENQLKANATSREIYIKANDVLIQQLNVAVEKGLALEQLNFNLFTNTLNRQLEIEKTRLEQSISIYNAEVQAFNIRSQAYASAATVFKIKIDAALTKLEEFRARIEAQKAFGQLNQQLVETYQARLQAVDTKVKAYATTMEAAKVQTDIAKAQIELYKGDIEAYATRIEADKTRFQAYESQIKGEASKAGILEAEARAYASRVQAIETGGNLSISKVRAKIDNAQQQTQRYIAKVQAERERVGAQADQFRSLVALYSASVQGYSTELSNNVALKELDIKNVESNLRNAISRYEVELKKYDGESNRIIKLAELNLESLRTMSQYAAQLAAGAMSARNLGMSVTGSGSGSDSTNVSTSYNYNYS
jgi:hypothetical protein